MSTYTILIVLSGLIIFSYLFDLFAGKTRIPSVLLLLFLGVSIKQLVTYFDIKVFNIGAILPTLGTLGLILIVFEGALELKYSPQKNAVIKKSFFSALIILLCTTFTISWIFWQLSGSDYYRCFLNAIPFCVVSSAIAIPSAASINKQKREFIIYESSFSDILTVVLFNFILSNKHISIGSFAKLGAELTTILAFAVGACLFLLYLIGRITHHVKFFLIIAILILVYAIGQSYHLSSLIIVLSLGLFLNNANQIRVPWFRKYFIYPGLSIDLKQLHQLSAESAFLMRTFFFAIFGFTMDIDQLQKWSVLTIGGLILLAIYVIRFIYIKLVSKTDLMPELVIVPRGLISVLLFYNLPASMKLPGIETGLLFVVVLATSIIMSVGLFFSNRRVGNKEFENV
ncbi:cation:proton antiporter [Mucilaginibacter sp. Bleaf8]|uniref:cation:proton antiporter domain-containing protein n=1 Tax=Mucilaginibacter sp. Bleaf8 TaxID=2834430 RepID=UPI001BCEC193|nr:cation:proton antiporter [Mucilaginibacter sp. Bleaf8]MBS7566392.1 cation:proton antiporter [Mucilaginibacter sp. Bleaf8]